MQWDTRFEILVRQSLPRLGPGDQLDPYCNMQDFGLDSLNMVALLNSLEEQYEVTLPDEYLTLDTFSTPHALWSVLEKLR
jgi:hypothetical protein